MASITIRLGDRNFELDRQKAETAYAAKRVINGRQTMFFNILPLKYQWAYGLYKTMKANHWEPEDIQMQKDCEQWRDQRGIADIERWIIKMGIGYFSAAEGIVGDNILHVVREVVTAPELKLVLGRHAHEENIHADSLVYMISSLGINPHECEAMFEDIATIKEKTDFVVNNSRSLRREIDLTRTDSKQALAKNIFLFGQCMEGTQFYGLFGMVLALYRQNKFPGIGQMFRYTLISGGKISARICAPRWPRPCVWKSSLSRTVCPCMPSDSPRRNFSPTLITSAIAGWKVSACSRLMVRARILCPGLPS
jgi:ribonucleoside-diphosphate reductase beta chain